MNQNMTYDMTHNKMRKVREYKDLQPTCRIANAYTQGERIANPLERYPLEQAVPYSAYGNPGVWTNQTRRLDGANQAFGSSKLIRTFILVVMMLMGVSGVWADNFVIYYGGYYLTHNATGDLIRNATTTFDPSTCFWTVSGNNIRPVDKDGNVLSRYLRAREGTFDGTLNTNSNTNTYSTWTNASDNRQPYYDGLGDYYIRLNGTTWESSTTNSNRAYLYKVTDSQNTLIDNTILPAISSSFSGGKIQFSHTDLLGTYVPADSYTIYTFNNSPHNWYNGQDWGANIPTGVSVTPTPTYTWSLSADGGGVATIDSSSGELTLSGNPTGSITVRLTVSGISPLGDKTVDYTLTPAPIAENVTTGTTIDGLTPSPADCTLDYQGSQTFTVSPTATKTVTTTPAYVTLVNGTTTYYYYEGALHNAAPSETEVVTHPAVNCSWSITGSSAATISSTTGNSTTVTYSSVLNADDGATLTVTATTDGATDNKTATINLNKTLPTSITPEASNVTLCVSENDIPFRYTLAPAGCYDHIKVTSSDPAVAESGNAGAYYSNGQITIDAGADPGTATLTLTAYNDNTPTAVTATVTVTVQPKLALPTITFDNTTSQVTITSDVAGATIYYASDGGNPTTSSAHGTSPVTFTVSSLADVRAFATMTGYCSSTSEYARKYIPKAETPTLTEGTDGKITMACATPGVTICYTTDGTNPTPTTGTVYNNPFELPTGGTVKAIAVHPDYISSDIATLPVTAPAETPDITINPSGSVTIDCTTTGATIYYTTDGSEPTTSSTAYSGAFTVNNGVTVKAIATAEGYRPSEVATNRYMVASGTSGTIVTLNDAEDHSWSYYSDPDCPIRSLSPADVKITYYGDGIVMTGDNNYSASSTDFIQPGNTNYVGGAKVNVGGENENTFIYYKTLERGDATQTAWTFSSGSQSSAASRCPYTPIPNPFQVRPTYGSRGSTDANNFTGWRGFQCWRLKSVTGGAVYSAASGGTALAVNAIVNAETQIYFAPNSEYGMEVELEAVWARAYLVKGNNGNENRVLSQNVGVERNFMTLTANGQTYKFNGTSGRRITNLTYPVTISCYYPSGEAPDYTNNTVRGNDNNITLLADTKFENVGFYSMSSYTINAAGNNLIIGRGCTGTVNFVRGLNANASSPQYSIRLESGTYNIISLVDGHTNNTNASSITVSGTPKAYLTLGCDYDRAQDVTNGTFSNKLNVNTAVALGRGPTIGSAGMMNNETFTFRVKSGTICSSYDMNNYLANFNQTLYISSHGSSTYMGKRSLFIEGGEIAGVAGGMDNQTDNTYETVNIRMTGGHIRGAMYGGGSQVTAGGSKRIVVTGGTVTGWLGAGANGTSDAGGQTYGKGFVYFGGNAKSGGTGSNYSINGSTGGIIFGAGNGTAASTTSGSMQNGTNVVIADKCDIENNVYGGGNLGYALQSSHLYILGGTVNGGVFGGANQKQGPEINILMKDGLVKGGVYGGSNVTGTISDNVTMNINGGQVGTDAEHTANVHGGGLGQDTRVLGSVTVNIGEDDGANHYSGDAVIYGDVYGGSAKGKTNGNTSLTSGATTAVTLNGGTIHGSLYGGGLGDNSNAADVYGPVTVVVNGGSVTMPDLQAGVFGCNNVNGAPQSTVTVTVNNTDDAGVDNVFGGGNQADYTPPTGQDNYPTVTMNDGMVNNSVFGGGNEANILGNANVTMTGGTVQNRVFGGGNLGYVGTYTKTTTIDGHTSHSGCIGWPASTSAWTRGGKCTVTVSGGKVGKDNMTMPQDYGYVFGASRGETKDPHLDPDIDYRAYVKETEVTISGTAFIIGGVYGGSENGHVKGNTLVKIQGDCQIGCGEGQTDRYTAQQWADAETAVKGGIATQINAMAAAMPECSHWRYQAPYRSYDPNLATAGGWSTGEDGHTFYGNVFGGGSGYWPYAIGGNGPTNGYEWLRSAGVVEGSTKVEITGGHILTSVYGGNELTSVTGDSCVVVMTGGTLGVPRTVAQTTAHPVTCYLFGAGKGDPRPYFNQRTNVVNTRVEVGGTAMIYGSIFGGAEDGHVTGNTKVSVGGGHIGTWGSTYVDGNVFGAGRGFSGESLGSGVVQGNVLINISGGTMLGSIYGGGRLGSVGTYLVAPNDANYGKLMGSAGDTAHGNITINISGGTIGNSHEYIVPSGDWTQAWKETNNIDFTEFGSTDTDENRLMHTKGGNVFAGCMGRLYKLDGTTVIPNWPDMGKARKTVLNISGGTIKSNVYGGGEMGVVEEGTTITITGGTIGTEVSDGTDVKYTFGSVFGGGYGSDNNVNGTSVSAGGSVNARDYAGLVTGNTVVTMSNGHVWASVYGGGELARVTGNTTVSISGNSTEIGKNGLKDNGYVKYGGYRMGNVFGGGKGSLDYTAAGEIMGNATVTISGGSIYHNVYGGGALGSVGTYSFDSGTGTTTCTAGGTTTVTITGGTIGINGWDNGMVNGSSRGGDGDPKGSNLNNVAWVNHSVVNIGTDGQGSNFSTPIVFGAVYGGGENGHNYGNSTVNIFSGRVGNPDSNATWEHGHVYGAGCGVDSYEYDADNDGNPETYYNPTAGIIHGAATLNIKGGHIINAAYGGGALGTTEGKATLNVTGGRIGSVYGGPKGKEGAKAEGNAKFAYCGVAVEVNIDYANTPSADDGSTTQLITGSVFGGGEAGTVEGDVTLNMKKGLVLHDVYGGGALADTNIDNAQYYGQTNETVTSTAAHTTTVNLTGGAVGHNVYGGGLGRKASATETAKPAYVYGDVLVELNKTTANDDCVVRGVVHGANNYNGSPKGEVTVHIYKTVNDGANVKSANKDNSTYNLKAVYGGGNEAAYEPVAASTQTANVIIEGCDLTSIETVYGGGNAASAPGTHVVVNSCYEIGTIFGGGNGKDALDDGSLNYGAHVGYKSVVFTPDPSKTDDENFAAYQTAFEAQKAGLTYGTGEAKVDALGGRIHKVFGGSNTRGNVRKESVAFIDQTNDDCPLELDEVYGGGNEALMDGGSSVKLGCISYLKTLYGGANAANVGGDINLTVTSGRFERVFGGNNQSGVIDGSITVNIEETGCHPIIIGELYGCGNQAAYSTPSGKPHPTINVKSFTSIGRIFGGGLGNPATVTGSPTVNVNEVLGKHNNGSVADGTYTYGVDTYFDADGNFKGWQPTLDGNTVVVPAHEKGKIGAIHTIFGGGNAAQVSGNTNVNIGTQLNDYIAIPAADIVAGTTDVSRFYTRSGEGTESSPYAYAAATGLAAANTTYYEKVVGADIRGNVFGGGNAADVTGNTNVVIGKSN